MWKNEAFTKLRAIKMNEKSTKQKWAVKMEESFTHKKNVRNISHWFLIDGVNRKDGHMKVHDSRLSSKFWCSIFIVAPRFQRQYIRQLQAHFVLVD